MHHKLFQVLSTESSMVSSQMRRVTTRYATRSVRVPRCTSCKQLHGEQKRLLSLSGIWFCITLVPLGLFLVYRLRFKGAEFPLTSVESLGLLLGILAPIVVGGLLAIRALTIPSRHRIRGEEKVNDHPEIACLVREGWIKGEKPGAN
jgi:hypothetical protein